jgi:hypothetical protein
MQPRSPTGRSRGKPVWCAPHRSTVSSSSTLVAVLSSARSLASESGRLKVEMGKFLTTVRAA